MIFEPIRILVVEDNPVDAIWVKRQLARINTMSFEVTHVERLADAAERLSRERFDIILLDLLLPDSQGLETFLEIRNYAGGIPVVVASGIDDEELAIAAVRTGAQDYLVKDKWDGFTLSRSIVYAIERQRLLAQLGEAERSLRQSEERFRAVFEGAQDLIYIKDQNLQFTHVNPAMCSRFEFTASELVGQQSENLFGKEAAKHVTEVDLRVLAGETIEEQRVLSIRGGSFVFNTLRSPLRNAAGEIVGLCAISRDITDWKQIDSPAAMKADEYPSAAMRSTLERARLAAGRDTAITLLGESGSGKNYLAKYIHDYSARSAGPYFPINCAAVAPELVESELFGHEKGAFAGAHGRKRGLLELAEGGTLLLNEIGELSPPAQAKLMIFLNTRKFKRVGGEKEISVNARLIAAANRDLQEEVKAGKFRSDLSHRLKQVTIVVPPLRDRPKDIPLLVQEFLSQLQHELQLAALPMVDSAAMDRMKYYSWPGNLRELRNVLERAVILSGGQEIKVNHLWLRGHDKGSSSDWSFATSFPTDQSLNEITHDLKRSLVNEALRRSKGSRQGAARLLGISRYSLKHYMKALGMMQSFPETESPD